MAGPAFPSYAYNSAGQPALIVQSQAQFAALPPPGTWSFTPFAVNPSPPFDPGFLVLDSRMQQVLVESRIQSAMMAQAFAIAEDPQTQLRPDFLANDSALGT